jgi:hypothetical protein
MKACIWQGFPALNIALENWQSGELQVDCLQSITAFMPYPFLDIT